VNKIDRSGAHCERVLYSIAEKLTPAIIPMGSASELGTRSAGYAPYSAADADFTARLVDYSPARRCPAYRLCQLVDDCLIPALRGELAAQTRQALVHPVFFGSAITGAGVDALIAGIKELLRPAGTHAEGAADGPVSGTVFKIDRGLNGEKIAYVRMFSGTVRVRDRLHFGQDNVARVTAISVFERGAAVQRASVAAGQIGKLWVSPMSRIGDAIGIARMTEEQSYFAPPTLETIVVPRRPAHKARSMLRSPSSPSRIR